MSSAPVVGLTPRAAQRIRRISVATVVMLAAGAAVLSFAGLRELALQAGFPPELAWMFPLIVDGLVLAGSLGVISAALAGVRTTYFWFLTLLGVFISVVGNIASAPEDFLSQSVHAAPPLIFALSVEGLLKVYRHAVTHKPDVGSGTASRTDVLDGGTPSRVDAPPAVDAGADLDVNVGNVREDRSSAPAVRQPAPVSRSKSAAAGTDKKKTARDRLAELLASDPEISGAQAARQLGIDASHARRLLRELREATDAAHDSTAQADALDRGLNTDGTPAETDTDRTGAQ